MSIKITSNGRGDRHAAGPSPGRSPGPFHGFLAVFHAWTSAPAFRSRKEMNAGCPPSSARRMRQFKPASGLAGFLAGGGDGFAGMLHQRHALQRAGIDGQRERAALAGSLRTVMSPPRNAARRLLIASPRPVPPNCGRSRRRPAGMAGKDVRSVRRSCRCPYR